MAEEKVGSGIQSFLVSVSLIGGRASYDPLNVPRFTLIQSRANEHETTRSKSPIRCIFVFLSLSLRLFKIIILALNGGACRVALSAWLLVFPTFREIVRRKQGYSSPDEIYSPFIDTKRWFFRIRNEKKKMETWLQGCLAIPFLQRQRGRIFLDICLFEFWRADILLRRMHRTVKSSQCES